MIARTDSQKKTNASQQPISRDSMSHSTSKSIFLAAGATVVGDIFDENRPASFACHWRCGGSEAGPVTDAIFEESAANAEIIIGQIELPESRLQRAPSLRAGLQCGGKFSS